MTLATEARRLALSTAIDRMNARFGRGAVTVGHHARAQNAKRSPASSAWMRNPSMWTRPNCATSVLTPGVAK